MKGKLRCRMHGGRAGAPKAERNGAYRHGRHTREAVEERRRLSEILRLLRAFAP
ncbi:hypothetical protein [Enterovirga sp.]|uniref:hypothetical protein n=1 Tax=Enterovirga sp. TaxID=2026350 RepID=UPI002D0558DD|nr:hypothetical protein [Enterovirga sp.]HMO31243.1 hypothetical protein [Enterovirga sp.]